jgi:hypothetical protein
MPIWNLASQFQGYLSVTVNLKTTCRRNFVSYKVTWFVVTAPWLCWCFAGTEFAGRTRLIPSGLPICDVIKTRWRNLPYVQMLTSPSIHANEYISFQTWNRDPKQSIHLAMIRASLRQTRNIFVQKDQKHWGKWGGKFKLAFTIDNLSVVSNKQKMYRISFKQITSIFLRRFGL